MEYIEDLYGMKLYKNKSLNSWILGNIKEIPDEEKPRFSVTFRIDFSDASNIGNRFGLKNLYNVSEVGVSKAQRGFGLATKMYTYFIKKQKYNIIGDEYQFFGARKLWSKLSRMTDLIVDIIDVKHNEILETDTKIHHGLWMRNLIKEFGVMILIRNILD